MANWRAGLLTELGHDGAGVLLDRDSGEVYAFTLQLLGNYQGETISDLGLTDGTPVRFLLDNNAELAIVETKSSLLNLAASLAPPTSAS